MISICRSNQAAASSGLVLQSATTLTNGGDWHDLPPPPTEINGQKVMNVSPTGPGAFFRLRGAFQGEGLGQLRGVRTGIIHDAAYVAGSWQGKACEYWSLVGSNAVLLMTPCVAREKKSTMVLLPSAEKKRF